MQNADGQVLIRAELDTAAVERGIAEMKAALNALKTYAARQFALIRSQAQTESDAITAKIPSLASKMVGTLATGLSGGASLVGGALRGVLGAAVREGIGYAPQFSSVGSYVISGIINGIRGAASSLWNTLRGVAANMLATLKSALGIESPSRVMREEVGRQIGAGIAAGMLDSRAEIEGAAQTLTDGAVGAVHRTTPVSLTDGAEAAMQSIRPASLSAAGALLRTGTVTAAPEPPHRRTSAVEDSGSTARRTPAVSGNTFIFQKPVETPYRHAQAIRETMEEMLYGT